MTPCRFERSREASAPPCPLSPLLQALVNQQQGKAQKAFVEYQEAHDAHAASKLAIKAIEPELMAGAGAHSWDQPQTQRTRSAAVT